MRIARPSDLDRLAWGDGGLLPVVVQEVASGAVLMLAWADREAAARTLAEGEGWFWSRSRRRLWRKGESSGNSLAVVEVTADCDRDALLYRVDAAGPACHTGSRSCFEAEEGPTRGRARSEQEAEADDGGGGPAAAGCGEGLDERGGGPAGGETGRPAAVAAPRDVGNDEGERTSSPRSDSPAGAAAVEQVWAGSGERRGGAPGGAPCAGTASAGRSVAASGERPGAIGGEAGFGSRDAVRGPRLELGWLWDVLRERAGADPAESYTARLLAAGVDRVARKVGEEATEVVIAALRTAAGGAERRAVAPRPVASIRRPGGFAPGEMAILPASAGGPDADPHASSAPSGVPSFVAAPPSAGPAPEAAPHARASAGDPLQPDPAAPSGPANPAPSAASPLRHPVAQREDRAARSAVPGVPVRGPVALVHDAPPSSPLAAEAADLLYHLLVLLLAAEVGPDEVAAELRRRHARPVTPPSPKPEDAAPLAGGSRSEDRR